MAADETTIDGVPMSMLLRKVMQDAGTLSEAVKMIREAPGTCAYNVLVGDAKLGEVQIVEVGLGRSSVRVARGGLLFGQGPVEGETGRRYARARRLAESARGSLDVVRVMEILRDRTEGRAVSGDIWSRDTVHSVVFEPAAGKIHVAQPDAAGAPGEYAAFSMEMSFETES